MENIFDGDRDSNSSEEDEEMNAWSIKIEDEISYWEKYLIDIYIYQPKLCPICAVGKFSIRKNSKNNIVSYLVILDILNKISHSIADGLKQMTEKVDKDVLQN
mgnify:CR=1 FL=1